MADFTNSATLTLLTQDEQAHPVTVVGAAVDVDSYILAQVAIFHAPIEAVASTVGVNYYFQRSLEAAGNADWQTIVHLCSGNTSPDDEVLSDVAGEPLGEKVMTVAATAGFAAGQLIYVREVGDDTAGEWHIVQEIAVNTSINLMDGLTAAKVQNDIIWNEAQIWPFEVELGGVKRVRLIVQHEDAAGPNIAFYAKMVCATDIE